MRLPTALVFAALWLSCVSATRADVFGTGDGSFSFEIEFVPIGVPGNPADEEPNPSGAVNYAFRMAKYEVSTQMMFAANQLGNLAISADGRGFEKPATSINWFEAAQFANWLNTSTGHHPAYRFDANGAFQLWRPEDPGYNSKNPYRNRQAKYFLPSRDEWYKAAYFDPMEGRYWDYPTGSDDVPDGIDFPGDPDFDAVFNDGGNNLGPNDLTDVGIASPFGTFGQGGNVREWLETPFGTGEYHPAESRALRGGSWGVAESVLQAANTGIGWIPSFDANMVGLRIAAIPEPSSFLLWILAVASLVERGRRRRRRRIDRRISLADQVC